MDMMRQACSTSLFHASQQWSTILNRPGFAGGRFVCVTPRVPLGRYGAIFENCASVSQNWPRIIAVSFRKP
jgi:hypothetical protein